MIVATGLWPVCVELSSRFETAHRAVLQCARATRAERASFALSPSRVNLQRMAASRKEKPDLQKKVHEVARTSLACT